MWERRLPGKSTSITVLLVAGLSLFDAEDTLAAVQDTHPDHLLGETVNYWRYMADRGKANAAPPRRRAAWSASTSAPCSC